MKLIFVITVGLNMMTGENIEEVTQYPGNLEECQMEVEAIRQAFGADEDGIFVIGPNKIKMGCVERNI